MKYYVVKKKFNWMFERTKKKICYFLEILIPLYWMNIIQSHYDNPFGRQIFNLGDKIVVNGFDLPFHISLGDTPRAKIKYLKIILNKNMMWNNAFLQRRWNDVRPNFSEEKR